MKYIKTFEDETTHRNKIIKYNVGDYVVYEMTIGIIIEIDEDDRTPYTYAIVVDNGAGWLWIKEEEILFSSPNEKDIEMYINANKYNL